MKVKNAFMGIRILALPDIYHLAFILLIWLEAETDNLCDDLKYPINLLFVMHICGSLSGIATVLCAYFDQNFINSVLTNIMNTFNIFVNIYIQTVFFSKTECKNATQKHNDSVRMILLLECLIFFSQILAAITFLFAAEIFRKDKFKFKFNEIEDSMQQ